MLPSNPSREFIRCNPHLYGAGKAVAKPESAKPAPARERKARAMNQTERRMLERLESQRTHRDDIIRYEGITLRFNMDGEHVPSRYTPDFFVREFSTGRRRCIEVKGRQIWPKDLEKFKGARAAWGTVFEFEMHRWQNGKWERLY